MLGRQRPGDIPQSRLTKSAVRAVALRLEEAPGNMGFIGLLTRGRKRRWVFAPAAVRILRVYESLGGAFHGGAVLFAELSNPECEADENLPRVKGNRSH